MTFVDTASSSPDQDSVPYAEDMFPDRPEEKGITQASADDLPYAEDMFPDHPLPGTKGAVAPGPVGDWLFGNTQHSSLARIMHAFGQGVEHAVGPHGENLKLSEKTEKELKQLGVFNDYAAGQYNVLKGLNETLLRGGAVMVNSAIYGIPVAISGIQGAIAEAGEQAEQTKAGKAIGAKSLAREIAAAPEAFPDFNLANAGVHTLRMQIPRPLAIARDLDVIGPGGEAAWKGLAPVEETKAPVAGEAAPVEAPPIAEAPPPAIDVHAAARAIDQKTFAEYDALAKRRDTFRKWIEDPEDAGRDLSKVATNLKETEARLKELEPAVTQAYGKAREGIEPEPAAAVEAVEPKAAAETPPTAEPAPAATPAAPRAPPIAEQKATIAADVQRQIIAAGKPENMTQAEWRQHAEDSGKLTAARYEARTAWFEGKRGTAQELYEREAPEILGHGQRSQENITPRAPRKVNEEKLSLAQFLAHRGGLQETPDLRHILDQNPFIPGFGRLFRRDGMTEDRAREAASEAGYLTENQERTGKQATIRDLYDALSEENRGRKRYRQGHEPEAAEREGPEHEEFPEGLEPHEMAAEGEDQFAHLSEEDRAAMELFQRPQAPPFYSMVDRAVASAKQEKASPDQWLGMLKNTPGVKAEEMEWLGLGDWLKQQKGSVTKAQIADYVRANAIEVKEVTRGGESFGPEEASRRMAAGERVYAEGASVPMDPDVRPTYGRYQSAEMGGTPTKFNSYTIPGGENYREMLLTLPEGAQPGAQAKIQKQMRDARNATPRTNQAERDAFNAHMEKLDNELERLARAGEGVGQPEFKSSHWDEPNILAHVRMNDRVIDGKKTLLVEEVQSDWHQKGKREGYRGADLSAAERAEWEHLQERNLEAPLSDADHARFSQLDARANRHGVPDAPFKTTWPELAMKRMIRYAAENGYEKIAWTTGETQAARYDLSKHVSDITLHGTGDNLRVSATDLNGRKAIDMQHTTPNGLADIIGKEAAEKLLSQPEPNLNNPYAARSLHGLDLKVGGEGMRGFYDQILPATVGKLVKKFGAKVGKDTLEQTGAFDAWVQRIYGDEWRNELTPDRIKELRENWMVRAPAAGEINPVHTVDITPELHAAATEQGFPLFQQARGSVQFRENQAPVMRILRAANASTYIHESGHVFLEELMRDAAHEAAPEALKTDAKTVRDWLGIESHADLNTGWPGARGRAARAAHEKFATAFEQYLREGVAPSKELAAVFARFRDWLIKLYDTIAGLGHPIPEGMRQVFDRLLAKEPERTVIAPERAMEPGFEDIHEAHAEAAPPEQARKVANTIQSERDSQAPHDVIKNPDARLENVEPGTGSRAPGSSEPPSDANATGATPGSPGASAEAGKIGEGGSEAAAEGDRVPPKPETAVKSEPPAGPNAKFDTSSSGLVDKAGNIRLDKLATGDDVLDVIRDAARTNNDFMPERRGVLSDGDTLNLSDALGMDPAWLDRKKIGEAFNVEEIRAARRLLVQSATTVRDAMIAAKNGATESVLKLAEAIARHEMIQGKVAQATAEAGRALRAFREFIPGQENIGGLNEWLKQNTGRTLFQLQEMAQFGANLTSPSQVSRLVHDTANGKIKQAIVYYYVNALISGPITHFRYAVGNAVTALYDPLVRIPIAAGVDYAAYHAGLQNERRIFLGEAGAALYAVGKGSREGWRAAGEGWRTGTTPQLPGEAPPDLFNAQPLVSPIPGKIGYAIGLPGKGVGAIHGFGAAVRYEQEISRLAYRTAMREGLQGEAFTARTADLSNRPTPEMMDAAAKVSRSDLYMAMVDYNSFSGSLARMANSNVLAKIILPFTKIGIQIESKAVQNSPLGVFSKQVRENIAGKNGIEARNTQAASIIGGTALMGTMAMMVAEGMATGEGPDEPGQREIWLRTHQPYSIQIGNITVPYKGLGYLGILLGIAANASETHQGWDEDAGHSVALAYLHGFQKAIMDDSWLRGVKDMLDAVYHWEQHGDRWIANMVTNWIPFSVGLGQTARLSFIDPYQRETRADHDTLQTIFKEAQAKIPFASRWLPPKRDVFGEPITHGLNPIYTNDKTVQAMNDLHIKVGELRHQIRGVHLTDDQYGDYARIAGRTTKLRLDSMMQTAGSKLLATGKVEDRAKAVELMHQIITHTREETAKLIMAQAYGGDNDILNKAKDAKMIKKGIVAPPPGAH